MERRSFAWRVVLACIGAILLLLDALAIFVLPTELERLGVALESGAGYHRDRRLLDRL